MNVWHNKLSMAKIIAPFRTIILNDRVEGDFGEAYG